MPIEDQTLVLREKLENHVCRKALEAVLQEQAEWVGLSAATQDGSPFSFSHSSHKYYKKVIFVQSHTQLNLRPRLQVILCTNLFSLYFSIKCLKYFITAFYSTESLSTDSTVVLTHKYIAQETVIFSHTFLRYCS